MSESNFSFLTANWATLAKLGQFAERYLYDDPNTAMMKMRQLGEALAVSILQLEEVRDPEDHLQNSRLQVFRREEIIPSDILTFFHSVKNVGNQAVHAMHDSQNDALTTLKYVHTLCAWFAETYGDWQVTIPPYVVPEHRQVIALSPSDLQRMEEEHAAELRALRDELKRAHPDPTSEDETRQRRQRSAAFTNQMLNEADTRRQLIDQQLRAAGWEVDSDRLRFAAGTRPERGVNRAIAEWPAGKGRADYALFAGLTLIGIVEAKKAAKDVVADLEQAKRYAKQAHHESDMTSVGSWGEYVVPFLFSTNGRPFLQQLETKSGIWFLDARKTTNHPRPLRDWYSPDGLLELLKHDADEAQQRLVHEPLDYLGLREYQYRAISAVEEALSQQHREILIAMATGTGKTRMAIGLIYRLIKSKRFRRVLFLVDREALGQQAKDAFDESRMEDFHTFTDIFELQGLRDKHPTAETKVQIATVQGMVKRILFAEDGAVVPNVGDYDCILVDEAHRGYILDREMTEVEYQFRDQIDYISKYRTVLEHFDAVKIGLTATPALHTTQIFGTPVFTYSYREAVIDGFLVDHEPPYQLETVLKHNGIHWGRSEAVEVYRHDTGGVETEYLPDDVDIDIEGFNTRVLTENFNRVVIEELVKHIDPALDGKTLVFAATDSHADLVVNIFKEELAREYGEVDDDAIVKITGSVHKPTEVLKRYKNEKMPNIAVTVDLLTTGVDVPKICNLVFLRRVKSRVLYEQMMGRATRLCPEIGKTHFMIYDAVGLYEALAPVSTMKPVVVNPSTTFRQLVEELQHLDDPAQQKEHIEQIIAKLQRKRGMERPEVKESLRALSQGRSLEDLIHFLQQAPFGEASRLLEESPRLVSFLDESYAEATKQYISHHEDRLIGHQRGYGTATKPDDYLDLFGAFVRENLNAIPALQVVCQRPRDLTRQDLRALQVILAQHDFTETNLRTAWQQMTNQDIAADIIAFIRQRAIGSPLVSHQDRVRGAMQSIYAMRYWDSRQKQWLERIEKQLLKESVLGPNAQEAFEVEPFRKDGGFARLNKVFDGHLQEVLDRINEALYA